MAMKALTDKLLTIFTSRDNVSLLHNIEAITPYGAHTLEEIVKLVIRPDEYCIDTVDEDCDDAVNSLIDYKDVQGQELGKRAMVISATGVHHVMMIGPPGSGKTMLAERLPTILPPLSWEARNDTYS